MSERTCAGCGATLRVHPRERNPRIWCSESCRITSIRERSGGWSRRAGATKQCLYCGSDFTPAVARQQFCQPEHGWLHRSAIRPKNPDWLEGRRTERLLDCSVCGVPVMTRGTNAKCPTCKAEATRATNRRKNAKRRGARIGANFTLAEIGERDGWRCHLCRRKVRSDLSGLHRRGPTIDHLVPVVALGVDEPENVALAHRDCNVLRRHLGAAQLRLIA